MTFYPCQILRFHQWGRSRHLVLIFCFFGGASVLILRRLCIDFLLLLSVVPAFYLFVLGVVFLPFSSVLRSSRCGSAIWLPRRHRPLRASCESSNHGHLTVSSFIPHALLISTSDSKRASHIHTSDILDFPQRYIHTFTFLSTFLHRISNHGDDYWFSNDMFLTSHLYSYPHSFTYPLTRYRHFLVSNATSENSNHRPSRTTPGIEPTVVWAPTSHR